MSGVMSDLGFRNGKIYSTTANKILNLAKPGEEFAQNIAKAEGNTDEWLGYNFVLLFHCIVLYSCTGGVIFIDEVYNFKPSKGGGSLNESNKVLNHLMDVAETMRSTTTFILGGYKDDVEELLTYNEGFPSRFPRELTFTFDDFSEQQLCRIFRSVVKGRNFVLQSHHSCGTNISLAACRQLGRGMGQKGFGNARAVRSYVDSAVARQGRRLILEGSEGRKSAAGAESTRARKQLLTREDVLGPRPDFSACPAFLELQSMIGLASVKEEIQSLVHFQVNNFEREMRGEKRELTKLFKVFLGNPGNHLCHLLAA